MAIAFALLLPIGTASAKEVIAYFGTEENFGTAGGQFTNPQDVAVNSTGAGAAGRGDIYVVDHNNNRIQRFAQNDNGTPANPYDDEYEFISAWGADVDSSPSGGSDYEICSVASQCKAAVASGGNGTAAGNGSLGDVQALAIDQDSGNVFVLDRGNARVNVYAGDGEFIRTFGFDVVASGPGDAGSGFEVCVATSGDICKAGVEGSGVGQISNGQGIAVSQSDGNPAAGTVFVADVQNKRVNTYTVDGGSPSSFGSATNFSSGPSHLAVDSRGIVYIRDEKAQIDRYDSENANGGGVGFLAPIGAPPLDQTSNNGVIGIEVDPDSDGPGPDADALYVARTVGENSGSSEGRPVGSVIQQIGPTNAPGLTAAPEALDAVHGSVVGFTFLLGLGLDYSNGRLFAATQYSIGGTFTDERKHGVYVLDVAGGAPSGTLDALANATSTSVDVRATVEPNGPPDVFYRIEYSTDGATWSQTPKVTVGSQETPQAIEATLRPPPAGLEPNTFYHVRFAVAKPFAPAVTTPALTFTTLPEAPLVETAGAPLRTTTSAQLGGRVNPRNSATTYRFEYGTQGPCDANPCQSSEPISAGTGGRPLLVSERLSGLEPNTTYHYRLVADNGAPNSPTYGEDMTVTTRSSEAPLSHGDFPGPPGSDRAYEMVSLPDSGGNSVNTDVGFTFSDNGDRAIYTIAGGTPISDTGSFSSFYFAERKPSGWQTRNISPPRNDLVGAGWSVEPASSDLSEIKVRNSDDLGRNTFWRLFPDGAPMRVFDLAPPTQITPSESKVIASQRKGPRTIAQMEGGELDPAYPEATAVDQLYDISSGTAQLANLLPGEVVPLCGSGGSESSFNFAVELSADGRLLTFPSQGNSCSGPSRLYLRDLEAGVTKLITPTPVSGLECGSGASLRLTSEAFFFWTQERLGSEDTAPERCASSFTPSDGDVYRYDLEDETLECVTCVVPGLDADVAASLNPGGGKGQIAVSRDGSRIYFGSVASVPLIRGAGPGTYVLETETGELRWAGPGFGVRQIDRAMNDDGSVILFQSSSAALNPLGGAFDNGGTTQLYRYDDRDRSLVCVSCPHDGSAPSGFVSSDAGLSADGLTTAFSTPTPLVSSDQNAPGPGVNPRRGTDVYEWRDGRYFLITDGLTDWPTFGEPRAVGLSNSGRDLYFTAFARYTPDALDPYNRLYDARIGGGFEYPQPPPPCPLEVCQGTPQGAPQDPVPSTLDFRGRGNPGPGAQSCTTQARAARRHAKAAKRLRRRARQLVRRAARVPSARRAKSMRKRARRFARSAKRRAAIAKKRSSGARRCRIANRDRRAGR